MSDILIEDGSLRLRRAELNDLNYILKLQTDPENSSFIISFDRDFHRAVLDGTEPLKMSVVIESAGEHCGYFLLDKSDPISLGIWHMIIEHGFKGQGLGRRALRLLKRWAFDAAKWHRLWVDCKDFNHRAIHLYTTEGFRQEALFREMLLVDGEYQNLIVFAMLDWEFYARKEEQSC